MFLSFLIVILLVQIRPNYGQIDWIEVVVDPPGFQYTVKAVCLMAGNRKRGILYANTKTIDGRQTLKLDRAKMRHCHYINFTFWRGNEGEAYGSISRADLHDIRSILMDFDSPFG